MCIVPKGVGGKDLTRQMSGLGFGLGFCEGCGCYG